MSVFLTSCSTKGSFDSIDDVYELGENIFPNEQAADTPPKEDPVVAELRRKLDDSERERERLSNDLKALKQVIQKKEQVILIQGNVIKLLDDSSHTLQKNIEELIAAPNLNNDSTASLPAP